MCLRETEKECVSVCIHSCNGYVCMYMCQPIWIYVYICVYNICMFVFRVLQLSFRIKLYLYSEDATLQFSAVRAAVDIVLGLEHNHSRQYLCRHRSDPSLLSISPSMIRRACSDTGYNLQRLVRGEHRDKAKLSTVFQKLWEVKWIINAINIEIVSVRQQELWF